jgi:hypothetical protein
MATASDSVVLGSPAGDFQLCGTDGRIYSFDDVAGERGTVIVFICNHCSYVKALTNRVVQDALALQDETGRRSGFRGDLLERCLPLPGRLIREYDEVAPE